VKAPLLYEMLKRKSKFPLHKAIKAEREDVVFLFLIENNSSLDQKINQENEQGKSFLYGQNRQSMEKFKQFFQI
jgi:hypothetical protein